jgi:hypothetical protein
MDSIMLATRMSHLGVNLNSWEQIRLSIAFNEGGKREFISTTSNSANRSDRLQKKPFRKPRQRNEGVSAIARSSR